MIRRFACPGVLAITLTLMPYVRREWLPRRPAAITNTDGSRDRALHGKARRRARREECQ